MLQPDLKANILIVGTNRYAQETLLPALYCLIRDFAWVGLYSSDREQRDELAARWEHCTIVDRLAACDWSAVDFIALTEPLETVPAALQQLAQYPVAEAILLLEPPILPRDRLQACQYFQAFKAVYAAVDCLAWPNWRVARALIAAGKIGTPQKLWLHHSSDRHHGIALARAFAGGAPVSFASRETFGPNAACEYTFRFPQGLRANILEPHDCEVGRFAIAGSTGTIVDYPLFAPNTIQIGYAFEGTRFRGITVDGDLQPTDARDWTFLDRLPYGRLPDTSLQALLRIRGLMAILHGLQVGDATYCYGWRDALYDALLPQVLQQSPLWWDPFAASGRSLLRGLASQWLPPAQRILHARKRS